MRIIVVLVLTALVVASGNQIKIDCHPDPAATKDRCNSRGCVWVEDWSVRGIPFCYFKNINDPGGFAGYDATKTIRNSRNIKFKLSRRPTPSLFGDDFKYLIARVESISPNILRVAIQDAGKENKKIRYHPHLSKPHTAQKWSPHVNVTIMEQPFGISINRISTKARILDTTVIPGLTFSKQFIQLSTRLPTNNIYGFGEHSHSSFRRSMQWQRWAMFARDKAPYGDKYNYYGSHPFYMVVESSGHAHGVLLANSHAVDVALQPDPIVTWRAIGGILEFYVFLGPTPDQVIEQYSQVVGFPLMPPYWGLGFQLCRYGYRNLTYLNAVWERNRKAQIPQDVQYVDIDYMEDQKDFTVDAKRFKGFSKFVDKLHQSNMKLVLITDPGIGSGYKNYPPLTDGLSDDIFIKSGTNKSVSFAGKCWSGSTYWPDFTHSNAYDYWLKQHQNFHSQISFDGLWYDMNEPSNMITGSLKGCQKNNLNYPPYVPTIDQNINKLTICMDAYHQHGRHYELHNLYGYTETLVSNKVLRKLFPKKRPFLLSRSTFPGSGKITAHWTGDVFSTWEQMQWSIVGLLDFSLFSIPWVGADICGFNDPTTEELCIRWSQLGSFYPFSRNHNDASSKVEQDPASWSPAGISAIRDALKLRYSFLPYLYTLFDQSHTHGTPVIRAIFFDYPTDPTALNISEQFMWGRSLMVAPILKKGARQRQVYFPEGRWFDVETGMEMKHTGSRRFLKIAMPLNKTGLFIKGGSIVPMQEPRITTYESRKTPLGIVVALNSEFGANGTLFWDDGETVMTRKGGSYTAFTFLANPKGSQNTINLVISRQKSGYTAENLILENACILGLNKQPRSVSSNGKIIPQQNWTYVTASQKLDVRSLNLELIKTTKESNIIQMIF